MMERLDKHTFKLLEALGILIESNEDEGRGFLERIEKEHPNSRIYFGELGSDSKRYCLVFPKGYSLQEWIECRSNEISGNSELSDNKEK